MGAPADVTHQDSQQSRQEKNATISAAAMGGVAGFLVIGPVTGVACAAGAAYAATRPGTTGKVARGVGQGGIWMTKKVKSTQTVTNAQQTVAEKARAVDEKLHISQLAQAVDGKLHLKDKALAAADKANALEEKYCFSGKAQTAAEKTTEAVGVAAVKSAEAYQKLDERHNVTSKGLTAATTVGKGLVSATVGVTRWAWRQRSHSDAPITR